MITQAWTQLRPHPVQQALWSTKGRFAIVPAGRGSGKTELSKRRLVRFLNVKKPWPDPRYFYAAPTLPQAKRIAWQSLLRLIPKSWIADISLSEMMIRSVHGAELWVVGLDKPQRIEGVQWDGGIVDESSDVKPGTFDLSILPALTWRNGWCWRIGVPKRYGIGAAEFRDAYKTAIEGEDPDLQGFTWPSSEIIPASALKYAREHMDVKDYDEQFGGAFVSAGGLIFHAFDEERNIRPCAYDPNLPILVGQDFNVDPMAWVLCHRKGDTLEMFDELWLRDANTPQALEVLKQRYPKHRHWEFYGDASGRARKTAATASDYQQIAGDDHFLGAGRSMHYLYSNPSQADRFAACNALVCTVDGNRRFFVDKRCKRFIHDVTTRFWKKGVRQADDKGDRGHITDAWGYIVYRLFPIKIKISQTPQVVTIRR